MSTVVRLSSSHASNRMVNVTENLIIYVGCKQGSIKTTTTTTTAAAQKSPIEIMISKEKLVFISM